MADVTIIVDDIAVRQLLTNMPSRINTAMRRALTDASALLLRDAKVYPPTRPNQEYKRTRTLGRSWAKKIEGEGLEMTALVFSNGNMAPYNRYVQDREMQAWMHVDRWDTIQTIAERDEPAIQQMFRNRIEAALR